MVDVRGQAARVSVPFPLLFEILLCFLAPTAQILGPEL